MLSDLKCVRLGEASNGSQREFKTKKHLQRASASDFVTSGTFTLAKAALADILHLWSMVYGPNVIIQKLLTNSPYPVGEHRGDPTPL